MKSKEFLDPEVIAELRSWIEKAGGAEVFAIGRAVEKRVVELTIHAIGNQEEVYAFTERATTGDVLIHNHPSGILFPSTNDLFIAERVGKRGVGFYIVDNAVERIHTVVLPYEPRKIEAPEREEVEALFTGKEGLKRIMHDYRYRPEQVAMAGAVAELLKEGGILLVEAGTGVGKSLAYLVPSLMYSLKNSTTIVVSTGTLTLQDQLLHKDLPLLKGLFGEEVLVTTLKGRGNYVSLRRASMFRESGGDLFAQEKRRELAELFAWLERTETGELGELPFEPSPEIWEEIESEADNCLRVRCPHYSRCYFFQSRRRAAAAHIVVVNHALLALDLYMRRTLNLGFSEAALLPPYSFLVLDEAHLFPEILVKQLGIQLSVYSFLRSLTQLLHPETKKGKLPSFRNRIADRIHAFSYEGFQSFSQAYDELCDRHLKLVEEVTVLFEEMEAWYERECRNEPGELPSPLPGYPDLLAHARAFHERLQEYLEVASELFSTLPPSVHEELEGYETELKSRLERLGTNGSQLLRLLNDPEPGEVAWIERAGKKARIRVAAQPLGVEGFLPPLLHELRGVVMTSATLATEPGNLQHFRERLGILHPDLKVRELFFKSPFDYQSHARLLIVRGVSGERYHPELVEALYALIAASEGRSLVLSTRQDLVARLGEELKPRLRPLGIELYTQGVDGISSQLLKRFLNDPHSVLLGTNTFWEGVDAPGETLRHVIMLKLPFPLFTHPYERARERALKEQGEDPFLKESLPRAILRFRQGFGRLIRKEDDWGVVTLLDERLLTRPYGGAFLRALPDLPYFAGTLPEVVEELKRFFREKEAPRGKRKRSQDHPPLRG